MDSIFVSVTVSVMGVTVIPLRTSSTLMSEPTSFIACSIIVGDIISYTSKGSPLASLPSAAFSPTNSKLVETTYV